MMSESQKLIDGLRDTIARLERENAILRTNLRTIGAYERKDYWAWQGDGSDHPESFGAGMAIVMTGAQVRAILADRDEADRRAGAAERKAASMAEGGGQA